MIQNNQRRKAIELLSRMKEQEQLKPVEETLLTSYKMGNRVKIRTIPSNQFILLLRGWIDINIDRDFTQKTQAQLPKIDTNKHNRPLITFYNSCTITTLNTVTDKHESSIIRTSPCWYGKDERHDCAFLFPEDAGIPAVVRLLQIFKVHTLLTKDAIQRKVHRFGICETIRAL